MALWLDLVPRIHRPDGFDPRYHLLDDYDNLTTFEEDEMRREIDLTQLHLVTPTSSSTSSTTRFIKTTQKTTTMTSRRDVTLTSRSRKSTGTTIGHPRHTVGETKDQVILQHNPDDGDYVGPASSVGLTVAVGVSLLCLNLVVFAAVYCQWKRLRMAKANEADDFDKSVGDSVYLQGTKIDPADCEPNNIARYLTEKRSSSHRTTPNDHRRYQGETLPLKVLNSPFHHHHHRRRRSEEEEEDYAVVERNTLPPPAKRTFHYDRISVERISPTDQKAAQDFSVNDDSSTLV